MTNSSLIYFLAFVLLFPGMAKAEYGCQAGFIPVIQGSGRTCVADYNLPSWANRSSQSQAAAGRWQKTWGAIATDPATGSVGVAVGQYTEHAAMEEALRTCGLNGGQSCTTKLAYENQCAVIAHTHEAGSVVRGAPWYQSAATVKRASKVAVNACLKINPGMMCKIIYSACAEPVLLAR